MAIEFIALGVLGGFVRGMYGLLKALNEGRCVRMRYFLVTLFVSAFIGGLLGYVFDVDFRVAALSGYVGTDVLENIAKGVLPKKMVADISSKAVSA